MLNNGIGYLFSEKVQVLLLPPSVNSLTFSLGKKVDHRDPALQSQATLLQLMNPEGCPQHLLGTPDAIKHPHGTLGPI